MKKTIITLFAIALAFGGFAQQNNQMFIHQGQIIHEFTISETDSIVFYRTQEQTIPPIVVVNRVETGVRIDTVFNTDTVTITDTIIQVLIVLQNGCNINTPGWGNNLGIVTHGDTVLIEGNGIRQIWSDAVTATACQKEIFNGGAWSPVSLNADCRSNPNFPGDLFSWCAIYRFAEQLCPYPWRIPSVQDFRDLDVALGGGGTGGGGWWGNPALRDMYLNIWGGVYGGFSHSDGSLAGQNFEAHYWSRTVPIGGGRPYSLNFNTNGNVSPGWTSFSQDFGFSVRCVR